MRIEKIANGRYEAITNINGYGVNILGGTNIPMQLVGYGDSHSEAIKRCLEKVDAFINKISYPEFPATLEDEMDDDSE